MTLFQARKLYQDLELLVRKDAISSSVQIQSLVKELKSMTINFGLFDPSNSTPNIEELCFTRDFNEINVIYALNTRNLAEYEISMNRLRASYDDCGRYSQISSNKNLLMSVYLLFLLSNNRIKDFHTVLESVEYKDLNDKHINFVLTIEQALTLGNYKDVIGGKSASTNEYLAFFLERILETIRFEIARSAEKSYVSLSYKDFAEILQFGSDEALIRFVNAQKKNAEENGYRWKLEKNRVYFEQIDQQGKHINSDELMKVSLQYAQEIEKIF